MADAKFVIELNLNLKKLNQQLILKKEELDSAEIEYLEMIEE